MKKPTLQDLVGRSRNENWLLRTCEVWGYLQLNPFAKNLEIIDAFKRRGTSGFNWGMNIIINSVRKAMELGYSKSISPTLDAYEKRWPE